MHFVICDAGIGAEKKLRASVCRLIIPHERFVGAMLKTVHASWLNGISEHLELRRQLRNKCRPSVEYIDVDDTGL